MSLSTHLDRRLSQEEDGSHSYIRVFVEDVGLGMVLEVAEVPPVGREALEKTGISAGRARPTLTLLAICRVPHLTFSCPITNCCATWFQRDFLKMEAWPRSCCRHQH